MLVRRVCGGVLTDFPSHGVWGAIPCRPTQTHERSVARELPPRENYPTPLVPQSNRRSVISMTPTKQCSKCGEVKASTDFPRILFGRSGRCRVCKWIETARVQRVKAELKDQKDQQPGAHDSYLG